MRNNPFPGKFIAFEGLDGAGKSTQVGAVIKYYSETCACQICATFEPTQFLAGGLVRARLLNEWSCSPECLQLLFAADRADHLEKEIVPLLEKGINVICDRYFLSSVVYGGVDIDMDWLIKVNSIFLAPDLTVFLDVPAEVCIKRMQENGRSIELFEKKETLERVSRNYRLAIEKFNKDLDIVVINGDRAAGGVTEELARVIDEKLFNFKNQK